MILTQIVRKVKAAKILLPHLPHAYSVAFCDNERGSEPSGRWPSASLGQTLFCSRGVAHLQNTQSPKVAKVFISSTSFSAVTPSVIQVSISSDSCVDNRDRVQLAYVRSPMSTVAVDLALPSQNRQDLRLMIGGFFSSTRFARLPSLGLLSLY
jgi:hypothetical protein